MAGAASWGRGGFPGQQRHQGQERPLRQGRPPGQEPRQGQERLLGQAEELQTVRQRLSADMADHSGIIRTLVVRSEDSRIMGDIKSLR